jgi:hypothetical protein
LYLAAESCTVSAVMQAVPHEHDRWDLFAVIALVTTMLATLLVSYLTGL